jgi:hypothetical protein
VAPLLVWRMWWGGMCPPARFLVPLVPVLAVAIALRLSSSPRGLARATPVLLAAGFALALFMCAHPGDALLLNRRDYPTRVWAALPGGSLLGRSLPSLVAGTPREIGKAAGWLVLVLAVLGADRLAARRRHQAEGL